MPNPDWLPILRALADPTRLRLIKALLAGPAGVNDLADQLGISQYNASRHLKVLRACGVAVVQPSGTRREQSIAAPFRRRLARESSVLDLGFGVFHFDQLPDEKPRRGQRSAAGAQS